MITDNIFIYILIQASLADGHGCHVQRDDTGKQRPTERPSGRILHHEILGISEVQQLSILINNTGQLQTGYSASATRRPNSCNRTEVLLRSHNREDGDVDSQGQSELPEESQQFNGAPQVLPNVSLSALISP